MNSGQKTGLMGKTVKKMPHDVESTPDFEAGSGYLSRKAQDAGASGTEGKETGCCEGRMGGNKFKGLICYRETVYKLLTEGIHQAEIIRRLWEHGYDGSRSNAAYYVKSIREESGIAAPKHGRRAGRKTVGIQIGERDMDARGLLEHLWMGKGFTKDERESLKERHPGLLHTECCIREFKRIFSEKNMVFLYLFIEKYVQSPVRRLSEFAKGLQRDIEAVENAVASDKSNGFVEGTNSLIKMIKRTMFGRCGQTLLSAKLMFQKW